MGRSIWNMDASMEMGHCIAVFNGSLYSQVYSIEIMHNFVQKRLLSQLTITRVHYNYNEDILFGHFNTIM